MTDGVIEVEILEPTPEAIVIEVDVPGVRGPIGPRAEFEADAESVEFDDGADAQITEGDGSSETPYHLHLKIPQPDPTLIESLTTQAGSAATSAYDWSQDSLAAATSAHSWSVLSQAASTSALSYMNDAQDAAGDAEEALGEIQAWDLEIGTVTTGSPGGEANASVGGTYPSKVLNLTIPQGPTGPTGATGATGPSGTPGASVWATQTQFNMTPGSSTSGVDTDDIVGKTVQVGDLVVSHHEDSIGGFGQITSIEGDDSVTITLLGVLDGSVVIGGAWGSISGLIADQTDLVDYIADQIATETSRAETAEGGKQPIDSDLTAIAGLAAGDDDMIQRKAGAWVNRTPSQVKTDLNLVKADVGLGNVDNTSDTNKPVSTDQQTALDAKLNKSGTKTVTGQTTFQDKVILGDGNQDVVRVQAVTFDVDTRSITLAYTSGKLTSVTVKDGATTVKSATLSYTGSTLNSVAITADGNTLTSTLAYTGSNLTGITRALT